MEKSKNPCWGFWFIFQCYSLGFLNYTQNVKITPTFDIQGTLQIKTIFYLMVIFNHVFRPPRETSREVANLTERKNPHTPLYGVKKFVVLSVCLWSTLTQLSPDWLNMMG